MKKKTGSIGLIILGLLIINSFFVLANVDRVTPQESTSTQIKLITNTISQESQSFKERFDLAEKKAYNEIDKLKTQLISKMIMFYVGIFAGVFLANGLVELLKWKLGKKKKELRAIENE